MPKAYHRPAYDRGRKDSARAARERARIREAFEGVAPAHRHTIAGQPYVLKRCPETGATILEPR